MVLGIYGTRIGQILVGRIRKSNNGVWQKTRPLRIWLFRDLQAPRNQAFTTAANVNEHFQAILEILNGTSDRDVRAKNRSGKRELLIFSPSSFGDLHTISNLALFQKNLLNNVIPTRTIVAAQGQDSQTLKHDEYLITPSTSGFYGGLHLYHLGNNPNSAILLQNLLVSSPDHLVIELHDIWIYDLLNSFGQIHGFSDFSEKVISNSLGAYGVMILKYIIRGRRELYTEEQKYIVASALFSTLAKINAKFIVHGVNVEFEEFIKNFNVIKFSTLALPSNYVATNVKSKEIDSTSNIIVSGSASYSKDCRVTTLILVKLATMIPNLRISILGQIGTLMQRELDAQSVPNEIAKKFNFIFDISNEKWRDLHKEGYCGMRLGVGSNGEASGVVRDYLLLNMKVVADEPSNSLRNYRQYFYFDSKLPIDSNVALISEFLGAKIRIDGFGFPIEHDSYKESLLRVLEI